MQPREDFDVILKKCCKWVSSLIKSKKKIIIIKQYVTASIQSGHKYYYCGNLRGNPSRAKNEIYLFVEIRIKDL